MNILRDRWLRCGKTRNGKDMPGFTPTRKSGCNVRHVSVPITGWRKWGETTFPQKPRKLMMRGLRGVVIDRHVNADIFEANACVLNVSLNKWSAVRDRDVSEDDGMPAVSEWIIDVCEVGGSLNPPGRRNMMLRDVRDVALRSSMSATTNAPCSSCSELSSRNAVKKHILFLQARDTLRRRTFTLALYNKHILYLLHKVGRRQD